MSKQVMKGIEIVKAWCWEFDGGLCFWAEPSRKMLGKAPGPGYKAVSVYIMRRKDWGNRSAKPTRETGSESGK
jgi:hypothetical protein